MDLPERKDRPVVLPSLSEFVQSRLAYLSGPLYMSLPMK